MSEFRYTCPNCNTTLKTAAAIPEGKAIKCPKCQTVFKPAAAPTAPAVPPSRPAPPPAKAPAPPPSKVSATPPAPKPPSKTATTKAPRSDDDDEPRRKEPRNSEGGVVHLTDHKGEITLPSGWKKKKPKSGGNLPIFLALGGGGLLVLLVCGGCCCIPIMTSDGNVNTGPGPRTQARDNPLTDSGFDKGIGRATLSNETVVGNWTAFNLDTNMETKVTFNQNKTFEWKEGDSPPRKGRYNVEPGSRIKLTWDPPTRPSPTTLTVSDFTELGFTARDANKSYSFQKN